MRRSRGMNEVKFITAGFSFDTIAYEGSVANDTLPAGSWINITKYPGVGTNQNTRIGNQINNVKHVTKIQLFFRRQITIDAATTAISFNSARVIIFTSPNVSYLSNTNIGQFFGIPKNTAIMQHVFTNRSNITVLFDKTYEYSERLASTFPESATKNPVNDTIGKTVKIRFTRRFRQVVFPSESTLFPKYAKQNTYLCVMQDPRAVGLAVPPIKLIDVECLTRTYFTD